MAMQKIKMVLLAASVCMAVGAAHAQDVYVDGYYRNDGTYVRPHVRSAPDSSRSNNYGPSQNSQQLTNPYQRDYDRDGTPNYLDRDSDNDGRNDDNDRNPYGWD